MKKIILALITIVIMITIINYSFKPTDMKESGLQKIGVIASISGEFAAYGEGFVSGVNLAADIYNKKNPDKPIKVVVENDEFDLKKAISAYKKLTGLDKVDGLINFSSPSINGIYDLVKDGDMVVFQFGEQSIEPADDLVFGLFPGSIIAEAQLGEELKKRGYKKPLLLYTVDDTAIRFKDAIIKGYGSPINSMGIASSDKDMKTHVAKIKNEEFDILVIAMFPQSGSLLVAEMAKQYTKLPKIAFDTILTSGIKDYMAKLSDKNILDGSIVAAFAIRDSVEKQEFIKSYNEKYNTKPLDFADTGYDAFNLLVKTYNSDVKKWKDTVQNISYKGANDKYEYNSEGLRKPDTIITEIKNGEIAY